MAELRRDAFTGQWVAVAPERSQRPHQPPHGPVRTCPFCPGNEAHTPPELFRVPDSGPWSLRVVPNRFGVVTEDAPEPARPPTWIGTAAAARGRHEVIIESPRHEWDPATATVAELTGVVAAYAQRCTAASTEATAVVLFRNRGAAAGTSLSHPHAQLVGLPVPTPRLQARWRLARRHAEEHGHQLHADLLEAELAAGQRVVLTDSHVTVFVPFAATAPYQVSLLPHQPAESLGAADDETVAAVASALRRVLAALDSVAHHPAYNLVVHNAPCHTTRADWFRWSLDVIPRTTSFGGLELGTGLAVTDVVPEVAASRLRAVVAEQPRLADTQLRWPPN